MLLSLKYFAVGPLGMVFWALGLHQKSVCLPILCLPSSWHPLERSQNCFLLARCAAHGPSQDRGVGVVWTELSQGCHSWLCATCAASVYDSLGERWGCWKVHPWTLQRCCSGPVGRRKPVKYGRQMPPLPCYVSVWNQLVSSKLGGSGAAACKH